MKQESITIVLPLPARVLSPNCTIATVGGRMMKAAAIKKLRKLTCDLVTVECIESQPWGVVGVKAHFFFKNKRKRDDDNANGSLKAAYDGIVDAGLVENDDYDHMKRETPVFSLDKDNPRVMLVITRVE